MGSIALPRTGTIHVDANVLIYSIERIASFWPVLEPLWQAVIAQQIPVCGSELLITECLVAPIKQNNSRLVATYESAFRSRQLKLLPVAQPILRQGAVLRAQYGLRTPDAIHAATAAANQCGLFLTNDTAFRRVTNLPVVILNDAIAQP
jgi:predicted nucleic acid-binding protein